MLSWKKIMIVGLISFALIGCSSQQPVSEKAEVQEEPEGSQVIEQPSSQDHETRTFVNQTDAWMIELPSTWNDVLINEEESRTEFIFPSKNPNYLQSLFWITKITEKEWEQAQKEGPIGTAEVITTKDGYVYLYYTPLDMVLEGEELKRYEEMYTEISAIIDSFKFE